MVDPTRTGLRLLVVALFCAVVGVLAFAPLTGGGQPTGEGQMVRVSHAALTCAAAMVGARQVSHASALVTDGVAGTEGTANLRAMTDGGTNQDIEAVGVPAGLNSAGGPQVPVLATGQGGWAAALVAGSSGRVSTGSGSGLYSAQCAPVRSTWWFVGAGSTLGRRDTLVVANPSSEPARFDVELYGRDGPVDAVAGRGLEVAGTSQVLLRMDALAPGEDLMAVTVRATAGQVVAAATTVAAPVAERPRGADVLAPAAEPELDVVIAGVPAGLGKRTLVLVNPGSEFATASLRALTGAGTLDLPDLRSVAVPAQSVVSIDLARSLKGRSASLHLVSDQPITGAVNAVWGERAREMLWLSATPWVEGAAPLAAAASVPAGAGLAAAVTVAAPEGAAFGTLTVVSQGSGGKSPFRPAAQLPSRQRHWTVVTEVAPQTATLRINVPAGTQRQLTLSATDESEILDLYWVADPGSAPVVLSHTVATAGLTGPSQDASGKSDTTAAGGSKSDDTAAGGSKSDNTATHPNRQPLATGLQWWPTVSAVPAVAVSAEIGVLVPQVR